MITFVKKTEPQPAPDESEENRFERIRKAAKERHRQSDTDGTRRRARQTAKVNRLIRGACARPEKATSNEIS